MKRHYDDLEKYLIKGKVLVIYGPRRTGKTTLLKNYLKKTGFRYKYCTGDDIQVRNTLGSEDLVKILQFVENYELIAIDEAQYIPNIGIGLKLLADAREDILIVVTGSSSLDLINKIGDPLTGRKRIITLFPFAQMELKYRFNTHELTQKIEEFLIFGTYPEVITSDTIRKKTEYLREIVNSYLLKDVLAMGNLKSPKVLQDLLVLLAFQTGSEVSHHELAQKTGMSSKTVSSYLDLLEKAFVLINLRGFSRNLRDEISKKSKYYFYDNGIRNAIISNFNELKIRNDIGPLWENFLVSERIKLQNYSHLLSNNYFWRTWSQKEIDWIEEREGNLFAYEFKWNEKQVKIPNEWITAYPGSKFAVIHKENYMDFTCLT